MRSEAATEKRKTQRSIKRWEKRREHSRKKHKGSLPRPSRKAQDPDLPYLQKLEYGREVTINLRGLNQPGKREEIERWMNKNQIDIVCAQETHVGQNSKEKRKDIRGI